MGCCEGNPQDGPFPPAWHDGVIVHMRGGGVFSCQTSDPITELVVTSHDDATLLTIQGKEGRKFGVEAIAVRREVWGIDTVAQEEGITPFLSPHIHSIHRGWQHNEPRPCLGSPYQPTGI